jgi:hypothetical protein
MGRFYLQELNDVDSKEQCYVKPSKTLAVLENVEDNMDINKA